MPIWRDLVMTFDSSYKGARFFKCDLQMQTPADASRWHGRPLGNTDEDMRRSAEDYIRRCYEVGLEVIAITDHNFASKGFIPYLQRAISTLKGEFNYEIILFPGFEFMANVGKGCHVLALFEPNADLGYIDHVLTLCGIPFPRFSNGIPRRSGLSLHEILDVVQGKDGEGCIHGIVICPHAQGNFGIFDNDSISEWLQMDEFINNELLCVEVPKPPSMMHQSWQKLFKSGEDCLPAWRRKRPIACIGTIYFSSDNM